MESSDARQKHAVRVSCTGLSFLSVDNQSLFNELRVAG